MRDRVVIEKSTRSCPAICAPRISKCACHPAPYAHSTSVGIPPVSNARIVWSPSATKSAVRACFALSSSQCVTSKCRGRTHFSIRPRPFHSLAKTNAVNSPPSRRSPWTFPYQRARRCESVIADQRSSISVSNRALMRTVPTPPTVCNVPAMLKPRSSVIKHSLHLA